jgi:hypothetical protein
MMALKHAIELQPFAVPNFVLPMPSPGKRQDGWAEPRAIPLAELDVHTLDELCAEFRAGVFAKAGKTPNVEVQTRP